MDQGLDGLNVTIIHTVGDQGSGLGGLQHSHHRGSSFPRPLSSHLGLLQSRFRGAG